MDSIRNRYEFIALRDKGLKQVCAHFILQGRFVSDETVPAFGLTASKKIGNAVRRNRARRRLRALAVAHLSYGARPGWHYGLIARYRVCEAPFATLEAEFCQALASLHHLADSKHPSQAGQSAKSKS